VIVRDFDPLIFEQIEQFLPSVVVLGRLLSIGGFVPSKLFFLGTPIA
jgi:hypothetical protein